MMVLIAWLARLFGVSVSRLLISLALLGAIFAGITYVSIKLYRAGEHAERARIERQNQGAKDNADRAARTPDECNDTGGMWDPIHQRCDRP